MPAASRKIAVLALQGDFAEHEKSLQALGAETLEIRQASDLSKDFGGLVIPGGESTVMGKLLRDLSLFAPLRERLSQGLPVMATCAGLILLARRIADDPALHFATLDVTVRRNAYGRQLGSFFTRGAFGAAFSVKPKIALVVEGTTAADLPGLEGGERVCSVGKGPVIPVRILSIRNSDAVFASDFSQAGINQTLHRLNMQVSIDVAVLVLGQASSFTVNSEVVVAETVIVGEVPDTFLQTGGSYGTEREN